MCKKRSQVFVASAEPLKDALLHYCSCHNAAYGMKAALCCLPLLKSDLHLNVVGGGGVSIGSMGVLVEAMPSVKKAPAEVSRWALRELNRLKEYTLKRNCQSKQ